MHRLLFLMPVLFCCGTAQGERLPLEHYAALPSVQSMALSPNGERIALLHNVEGKSVLVARRPEDELFTPLLTSDNERGIVNWFRWANPDILLVSTSFAADRGTTVTMETRLFTIAADGGEPRSLLRDKAEKELETVPITENGVMAKPSLRREIVVEESLYKTCKGMCCVHAWSPFVRMF